MAIPSSGFRIWSVGSIAGSFVGNGDGDGNGDGNGNGRKKTPGVAAGHSKREKLLLPRYEVESIPQI